MHRLIAFLLATLWACTALAQWAVFDASNFTKNTLTALQTAQQYSQMVQSYMLQAQQYANMVSNTKALGGSTVDSALARSGNILRVYRNTAQLLNDASNTFQQAANFGADMNRMSAVTGMSWTDILNQDIQRARAGRQVNAGLYNQATQIQQSLSDIQSRADSNLQTASQAEGAVQALQALSMQNHALSDQISMLVTMSASGQQQQAVKDEAEAQDRERLKIQAGRDYQSSLDALRRLREAR